MKRLLLLSPLFLAACGAHFDPCVMPCPKDMPPHLCECQPYEGSDTQPSVTPKPAPETPPKPDPKPEPPKPPVDPKPEHPKPEKPKHEPKAPKSEDC